MARRLNPFLLRLSRWPRRIAALVCLLLAAASTLVPADGSPAPHHSRAGNPVAAALHAGQVAVPVTVSSARALGFVRTGDHVGILTAPDETDRAGPELVADGLRVLAVSGDGAALSGDSPVVVVAADRAQAVRLAAGSARPLLVVVDDSP